MNYRALSCLITLGAAACSAGPRYQIYGVDLESRVDPRAFVWPVDATGGTFRYVLESTGKAAYKVHSLRTSSDAPPALAAETLSGATVVLPIGATEPLRRAAHELLDGLALRYPGLSTHLVVTGVEWRDVRSTDDLLERVREALDAVDPVPRHHESLSEFLNAVTPDLIVVPHAGSDGFLIAMAQRRPTLLFLGSSKFDFSEATSEEVLAHLTTEPSYEPRRPYRWLAVLVPADADAAARRRCDHLLAEIYSGSHESWAVLRRVTHVAVADQLTDAEALQAVQRDLSMEAFAEGESGATPAETTHAPRLEN